MVTDTHFGVTGKVISDCAERLAMHQLRDCPVVVINGGDLIHEMPRDATSYDIENMQKALNDFNLEIAKAHVAST